MEDRATLSLSENGLNFPLHPLGNLSAGKSLPRPLPPQGLQPRKKASEQRERERGTGGLAGRWPTPPMGRADTRSQHRSGIQTNNLFNTIAGKKAGKLRRKWLARAGTFLFRKDIFLKYQKIRLIQHSKFLSETSSPARAVILPSLEATIMKECVEIATTNHPLSLPLSESRQDVLVGPKGMREPILVDPNWPRDDGDKVGGNECWPCL